MKLTTVTTYDHNQYETIGIVSVVHIEYANVIFEYVQDWKNILQSRRTLVEKRFNAGRQTCLNKMKEEGNTLGATEIIAIDIDTESFMSGDERLIAYMGTGTAIRKTKNEPPRTLRKSRKEKKETPDRDSVAP